jgi:hypothetical protein
MACAPGGDFGCDLVEMKLHGFAVTGWQHEGGADSSFWAPRFFGLIRKHASNGQLGSDATGSLGAEEMANG